MEKVIVEQITSSDSDGRSGLIIKINDVTKFSFVDGEPEDANLCRDFNDAYEISDFAKHLYELGKAGTEVEFISKEAEWEDMWD